MILNEDHLKLFKKLNQDIKSIKKEINKLFSIIKKINKFFRDFAMQYFKNSLL